MVFIHYTAGGLKRTADLQDVYTGLTAFLVGGSPSLKDQPVHRLNERGVLAMAMNNAAVHFQPSLWASGDRPECYEPRILLDPRIMKFGILSHAAVELGPEYGGRKYWQMPNMYFYIPEEHVPWDEYLANRKGVPWYNNTLFVSINILYRLGVRRIILAGSDFGFSKDGAMYAHETSLGELERKWNTDLYNSLVYELRRMKPLFERAGLELMDCSVNSRIAQVYKHITMDEAVDLCLSEFPKANIDSRALPHCSKFANADIQERIAEWPGYQTVAK